MESQPQNPEFRMNPETFYYVCIFVCVLATLPYGAMNW